MIDYPLFNRFFFMEYLLVVNDYLMFVFITYNYDSILYILGFEFYISRYSIIDTLLMVYSPLLYYSY
jgi:hypothetical protein